MIFVSEISLATFTEFTQKLMHLNYIQTADMYAFFNQRNYRTFLLGAYAQDELVGVALVFGRNYFASYYLYELQLGPLMNNDDISLQMQFLHGLEIFLKKAKGIFLYLAHPEIIATYDSDFKLIHKSELKAYQPLLNSGYSHYGFYNGYCQGYGRYESVIDLQADYQRDISKHHQKVLAKTDLPFYQLEMIDETQLDRFMAIMEKTQDRTQIALADRTLFFDTFSAFSDQLVSVMAVIDVEQMYQYYASLIDESIINVNIETLSLKSQKRHQAKLEQQRSYLNKMAYAKELLQQHQKMIDIACAMFIKVEPKYELNYYYSGYDSDYGAFNGQYYIQKKMLAWAKQQGYRYFNLAGVYLNYDEANNRLFKFKMGFGGVIIERLGLFSKKLRPILYFVLRLLRKIKSILKRRH